MIGHGIYRPIPIARQDFCRKELALGWTLSLRTFRWTVIGYLGLFSWVALEASKTRIAPRP
jgi:hypothetical protein